VALVYRPLEVGRRDPVVMEIDAHAVVEIDAHLHGVVGVDAVAYEAFLLADGGERDRLALVVMINQIDPMRPHVTKWVARLDPLEGADGNFERLFQVSRAVKWRTDAFLDVVADANMVRVITLVHIDRHDSVLCARALDDLVRFVD